MSEPEMNDMPAENNASSSGASQPQTTGAQLAAYRKERGWTVEDVAKQLNLAPRQVIAIESDDYASLPGMPIVRGFIRAYAKLLKVDFAPLLGTLGSESASPQESLVPRKTLSTPFSEARLPSMMNRDGPGLTSKWIVGVLLLALLIVAIWAAQQSKEVTNLQDSAATQVKEGLNYLSGISGVTQSAAPSKAERVEQPAVPPAAPATGNQESTASTSPVAPPPAPVPAPAAPEQPAAPVAVPVPEAAAPAPAVNDALVLKARENSWVEIRRVADKRSMLSRLMKAGETETVEINEPALLVIGNASGIDATLRGEPLELKTGGTNVARLTLK